MVFRESRDAALAFRESKDIRFTCLTRVEARDSCFETTISSRKHVRRLVRESRELKHARFLDADGNRK